MTKVYIYPAFNARYYSRYIEGLLKVVGPRRMRFTTKGFPPFGPNCLALRIEGAGEKRIYINANDNPALDEQGLAWCDLFGKVNLDEALVPESQRSKVLAIGPTFAVRLWGPVSSALRGLANYVRTRPACDPFARHMANYRGQYASRFPEDIYVPRAASGDYIFFNAALWEPHESANALRARFVEAARSTVGVRFEGGLTPRQSSRGTKNYRAPGYERYLCRRYTPREYLERTKRSSVAMNNPAYKDCHSWRLGEYLALGKAIISTPIIRALPAPLADGTHIHYVDGSVASFRAAIERICADDGYRNRLERNARAYYEEHLAPASVIGRLFDHVDVGEGAIAVDAGRRPSPLQRMKTTQTG